VRIRNAIVGRHVWRPTYAESASRILEGLRVWRALVKARIAVGCCADHGTRLFIDLQEAAYFSEVEVIQRSSLVGLM
jgi:hypothetical protein